MEASLTELTEWAAGDGDPRAALRAVAALRRELTTIEAERVADAVDGGITWAAIASDLGTSRQAVHKRYARRLAKRPPRSGQGNGRKSEPMIVVTGQARRAVRAARIAALAMGHAEVHTAHMLVGLLADEDGPAARALTAIGVEFEPTRDLVARLELPPGKLTGGVLTADTAERVPLSDGARAALEQSLHEARRLGHPHLGVEHILLAVLRRQDDTSIAILGALDVSPADLERCLGKVLKESDFSASGQ